MSIENLKIKRISNKKYISNNGKIEEHWSKYDIMKYRKLRKISILMELPFEKWTKRELLDLIQEYDLWYMIQLAYNKSICRISKFVYYGEYERFSLCEELKKDK